jgi:hypothetical protein
MPGTISYVFASGGDPFSGRGRLNFPDAFVSIERDATNPLEVDVVIATGAGGTLQVSYDLGEGIVTDAQGAVDVTRGALCPDGEPALNLVDADANPGRTAAVLQITDNNVLAAETPIARISRASATNAIWLQWVSTDPGAVGPVVEGFHDSATPLAGDVALRLQGAARNDGTGKVVYARIDFVNAGPAAGGEFGQIDFSAPIAGSFGRVLTLRGNALAAQQGALFESNVAAGASPAFQFRAVANFGAGQDVLMVEDNAGGTRLFGVDGVGTTDTLLSYEVAGTQVVSARGAAVADAAGGAVIDIEARAALNALLARVRAHGLIAP